MTAEKLIRTTAKMYEIRETAKNLRGDKYPAWVEQYKTLIQSVAKDRKLPCLQTAIDLAKELEAEGKMDAGTMMGLVAAAVELTES
jgi:hypothetical protein